MTFVDVMICVNDPRNGTYCGRCSGVHISDFLQLEPRVLPEPRCTLGTNYFSLHRKSFEFVSSQTWVGNWCWDSIRMTRTKAANLIAHLLNKTIQVDGKPFHVWGIDQADGEAAIQLGRWRDEGRNITRDDAWKALCAEKVGEPTGI